MSNICNIKPSNKTIYDVLTIILLFIQIYYIILWLVDSSGGGGRRRGTQLVSLAASRAHGSSDTRIWGSRHTIHKIHHTILAWIQHDTINLKIGAKLKDTPIFKNLNSSINVGLLDKAYYCALLIYLYFNSVIHWCKTFT